MDAMAGTHIGGETKLWTRGSSRPEARPSLPRVCVRVVRSHLLLFFSFPSHTHTRSAAMLVSFVVGLWGTVVQVVGAPPTSPPDGAT